MNGQVEKAFGAIQTRYKNYHFRSRLEAKWAVFFDACGIRWEYEKEGFVNEFGSVYLPDFYLSESETWVEVKGDPRGMVKDYCRMTEMLDFNSPIPKFKDSYRKYGRGLLLLGDIPEGSDGIYYIHPILQHKEGIIKNWCYFDRAGTIDFDLPCICNLLPEHGLEGTPEAWVVETKEFPRVSEFKSVSNAGYRAARSARFEHGESGPT